MNTPPRNDCPDIACHCHALDRGKPALLPTVPGKSPGIVGLDPMVLQCGECGATLTQPESQRISVFIMTSGWHFHTCEGRNGIRRCRKCLERVEAECPNRRCKP